METIFEHPAFKAVIERQEAIMALQGNQAKDPNFKAAPVLHNSWVFDMPPSNKRAHKLLLLTIGGIGVPAVWDGGLGQHYVAYAVDSQNDVIHPN